MTDRKTSARQATARRSKSLTRKRAQRFAERQEDVVARAVGGHVAGSQAPVDVKFIDARGRIHGIEVKTLLRQSNDKITMRRDALTRKLEWARATCALLHTVAIDFRQPCAAVYYRPGVGSFRLTAMRPLPDLTALRGELESLCG